MTSPDPDKPEKTHRLPEFILPVAFFLILTVLQYLHWQYHPLRGSLWGSVVAEAFAICFYTAAVSGMREVIRYFRVKRNGVPAEAVITGYLKNRGARGTFYYTLKYSFRDTDGIQHSIMSNESVPFTRLIYKQGKKLNIAYLPEDPENPVVVRLSLYNCLPGTAAVAVCAGFAAYLAVWAVL